VRDDATLKCRVVMMRTAGDVPRDEKQWEETGIAAHLLKPVTPPELLEVLLTLLAPSPRTTTAAGSVGAPSRIPPRPGRRILLVEDSLMNQRLAATILRNAGHEVVIANHGQEAVAAWEAATFDLILMDIQMPEMDGLEATRVIREGEQERGGHVAILALTAYALKGDRERFLEAGMDGYIAKPLRARDLLDAIDSTLARREA
jgi:CheY-like chemotaxis protein